MLIENAIHSQQVYDPTDDSIMAEQAQITTKEKQEVPLGNSLPYLSRVDFCRVRPGGRTLFLLFKRSKLYSVHRPYQTVSSVPESGGD